MRPARLPSTSLQAHRLQHLAAGDISCNADGIGGLQDPFSPIHQAKGRERHVVINDSMCGR